MATCFSGGRSQSTRQGTEFHVPCQNLQMVVPQSKSNSFEPKVRYHSGSERVEIEHESLLSILDSITSTDNSQTTQGIYDDESSAGVVKGSDIGTDTSAINTEDSSTNEKRQMKSVEDCKKTIGRNSEVVKNVDQHIDEYGIFRDDHVEADKAGVFDTHEVDVKEIDTLNIDETEPIGKTKLQNEMRISEVIDINTLKEKISIHEAETRGEGKLQIQTRKSEAVDDVDEHTGEGCTSDEDSISTAIERKEHGDQRRKNQDGESFFNEELHNDSTDDYPEQSCVETNIVDDDDFISEENEAKLMIFKDDEEIDKIDDENETFRSENETDYKNTEVNTTGMKDKDQDGESEHKDEISNEIQDETGIKMTDDSCANTKGNEHGREEIEFEGENIEECNEEASINATDKNTDDINTDYGSEKIQVEIHDEVSRNTQDRRENLNNENITEEETGETHDEDFRYTQEDFHNNENLDNENNDENITEEENDDKNDEDFRNTQEDFHHHDNPDNENSDDNTTGRPTSHFVTPEDNTQEDFHHHDNHDNENNHENITEEENDDDTSNSQEDLDHRDHVDNENNDDNITDASHFVTPEDCNNDVVTRNLERDEDRDSCKIS